MKCPRCGNEMTLDEHRNYPLFMCYECGYMEGREFGGVQEKGESNFERLKTLSFNEAVAFLAKGLQVGEEAVASFLGDSSED